MLENGTRIWTIVFYAFHGYGLGAIEKWLLLSILFLGICLSLGLAGILFFLSRATSVAVDLARGMTRDLNETHEKLRAIVDTAQDAIVTADHQGLIVSWNRGADHLFGYSADEMVGKPLIAIIPERLRETHEQGFRRYLETGEARVIGKTVELTGSRKGGEEFPLEISLSSWKTGQAIFFTAIIRDITERKKLEAELFQSQKMETVGTLAGGIAHDLNNQLTPVKGYLDLLLNQTDPGHPSHHLLSEAGQSAERCAEVIQRLMNFSRSSGQKRTILSPAQILNELKVLLNNFLPANIRVFVDGAENIWPVEANETEFQTVLMNLVVNARDAMPDGGELRLKAENINVGPHIMISVKDTGIGMPPEVLSHIFEPFYTTKKRGQGTGLGLAMVFKTVKGYGGWIDVSSEVKKGSIFQVYFPAKPNAVVVSTVAGAGILNDFQANGETILFADDEEPIRNLGKVFLERLGYKVLLASDGGEVISIYQNNFKNVAALVLDMTMPKLTGRQMLARVLAINPKAKVIIVSGYTSEGGPRDLVEMGAREFLQKPYTIFPLGKILKSVLTSKN